MTIEHERERITKVYSGMSDAELEKIVDSGDELTDVANEALQAEIVRRGIQLPVISTGEVIATAPTGLDSRADDDVVESAELVTLRQFRDLPDALLAKGSLESAGIESYLIDENMVRMDWFISNLLGGIKLKVHAGDAEAANEILNQPIPETIEIEGSGSYDQPKCPQCQSLDVSYRERLRDILIGQPTLEWTCNACGNEWEASEAVDPAEHNATNS